MRVHTAETRTTAAPPAMVSNNYKCKVPETSLSLQTPTGDTLTQTAAREDTGARTDQCEGRRRAVVIAVDHQNSADVAVGAAGTSWAASNDEPCYTCIPYSTHLKEHSSDAAASASSHSGITYRAESSIIEWSRSEAEAAPSVGV